MRLVSMETTRGVPCSSSYACTTQCVDVPAPQLRADRAERQLVPLRAAVLPCRRVTCVDVDQELGGSRKRLLAVLGGQSRDLERLAPAL